MDLNLGKRIEIKRVTKDLNKTDFGKLIGISRQAVYNIEKNKSKPGAKRLEKICAVLECTPNDLLL